MAKVKQNTGKTEELTKDRLIEIYMDHVLENEEEPGTVYKFCKQHDITEAQFYNFFGSFEGLKKAIWEQFFIHSLEVMQKTKEYALFNNREKMLSMYYTFFEVLTANRSYVLFSLKKDDMTLKNIGELKSLRKQVKNYAAGMIREANEKKQSKLLQRSETVFSEAAWVQLMFLLKFWIDDNSPQFESTDIAIEKSVNTVFDLFENTPLESVLDLGKFLWKEKMT
jgi:AcrR family transcriptional regulator